MATKTLTVNIAGDPSGAQSAFKKVESDADGLGGKLSGLGAKISPGMAAAAGAVVAGVGLMLKGAFDAADESAKIGRATEQVLKTTGATAWTSADQVADYAGELSRLTGVDDEVIQSGENLMLTFTQVQNTMGKGNDIFDQATAAALDMSSAMGTDMQSAVVLVGKALNDPIKGLTALSRVGVSFTEQQKDQIRAMVGVGDVLGAQKVILQELQKEFGGAAAAAATPLDKLKVQVGNLQEQLGATLIPIVASVAEKLSGLVSGFTSLPGPIQAAIAGVAAFGTAIAGGIVVVAKLADVLSPVMSVAKKAMDAAAMSTATFVNKLGMSADSALTMGQNLGQALGAAGVLAAGAIAAWTIWNAKIHETDEQIKGLTDIIKDKSAGMSMSELGDYIGKVRSESQGLSDTIANSHAPWDADYRAQLRKGRDELDANANALQALSDKANLLAYSTGTSADAALMWLQQEEKAGRTYSSNEAYVAAYTGAVDSYAYSARDAAAAAQSQADAIKEASDATRAAVDPFFAALDANQKLSEAQVEAFLTAKQYKDNSPQVQAANEALARAALGADSAYLALAEQMKRNGATSDEMKAAFQRWVDQGMITQGAADQLIFKFGLLGGAASAYGDRAYIPRVDADTGPALEKLSVLQRKMIEVFNTTGTSGGGFATHSGGRASGGPVEPWSAYKVHDTNSPELLSLNDGTSMLLTGASGGYVTNLGSGSVGGGSSVNVVINMPAGSNGDDVVEAIKRYERRNGTAWRN